MVAVHVLQSLLNAGGAIGVSAGKDGSIDSEDGVHTDGACHGVGIDKISNALLGFVGSRDGHFGQHLQLVAHASSRNSPKRRHVFSFHTEAAAFGVDLEEIFDYIEQDDLARLMECKE